MVEIEAKLDKVRCSCSGGGKGLNLGGQRISLWFDNRAPSACSERDSA